MTNSNQKQLKLRDGTAMPALGLGTWLSKPGEVYDAVRAALEIGYRHIDCAANYRNQDEVGQAISDAIAAGDVTRDALWVTSKLWNDAHRREHVRPAMEETLAQLRLDYLDLYLIHWPIAYQYGVQFPESPDEFATLDEVPLEETWEAMQALKSAELTRQIGVSNMGPVRLEALAKVAEMPAVVQVESHPHLPQGELREFGAQHDIAMTAYSPLGSPGRADRAEDEPSLLDNPTVIAVAEDVGATPAQVLISWALTRGTAVLPKSVHRHRIAQNFGALDVALSEAHMAKLAALDTGYRYLDGSFLAPEDSPYTQDEIYI